MCSIGTLSDIIIIIPWVMDVFSSVEQSLKFNFSSRNLWFLYEKNVFFTQTQTIFHDSIELLSQSSPLPYFPVSIHLLQPVLTVSFVERHFKSIRVRTISLKLFHNKIISINRCILAKYKLLLTTHKQAELSLA